MNQQFTFRLLIAVWILLPIISFAQLTPSAPISLSGASNRVIQNLAFTTGNNGACIYLSNCSNIKIINCSFINVPSFIGIQTSNCTNIEVVNCTFDTFRTGVYAVNSKGINVHCNSFKTIAGSRPRGQIVQFNHVSGTGNRINYNILEHVLGTGDPEDLINAYASSGTSSDPLQIIGNKLRGGGPSKSGGGIMVGDDGGHDIIVMDNILVDPGQYGIGAPAGYNITIKNNKVFAKQQSFTNVGIYVGLASEIAAGFPCNGPTIRVEGNQVNWTNKDGNKSGYWNCGCCSGVISSGNNWNAPINASILPATLSLDASKCGNSPVNQAPSVNINSPSNNSEYYAPATINISANASDSDGSIAKVEFFNGSTKLGEKFTSPYTFAWTSVSAGSYSITAKATDNAGAVTTSAAITVTVTNPIIYYSIPGKIEAENYSAMHGIQTQTTTDSDGGLNVGWIDAGDWMDYNVSVNISGSYTLQYRVASPNTTGQIQIRKDNSILATTNIPNTGGWQQWTTVSANINLSEGNQTIRLYMSGSGFNINWMNFSQNIITSVNPNPVISGISGPSCINAGGSYTYTVSPEAKHSAISWWSNSGATITVNPSDNTKITISIPSYMNNTSFVITSGVTFSASPWYKEYNRSIKVGGCTSSRIVNVGPQPFANETTIGFDDNIKIQSIAILDLQGRTVVIYNNINNASFSFGADLASGMYSVVINGDEGTSVTKIFKE